MNWKHVVDLLRSKPNNSHYLSRYIKFVEYCLSNPSQQADEAHHICPKSRDMFPEYKSFGRFPWNKSLMTKKQHRLAHLLLAKAYSWSASQSFCALKFFQKGGTKLFESLQLQRNATHAERMRGEGNPFYGRKHREESKAKMGLAAFTPEERKSIRDRSVLSEMGKAALSDSGKANCSNLTTEEAKKAAAQAVREFYAVPENREARKRSYAETFSSRTELSCPWCSKSSKHHGNMRRYHFDNCPSRKGLQA